MMNTLQTASSASSLRPDNLSHSVIGYLCRKMRKSQSYEEDGDTDPLLLSEQSGLFNADVMFAAQVIFVQVIFILPPLRILWYLRISYVLKLTFFFLL